MSGKSEENQKCEVCETGILKARKGRVFVCDNRECEAVYDEKGKLIHKGKKKT